MIRSKLVYKDQHLHYWQNWHQNNEFIRSIGDKYSWAHPPYTNLYIRTTPAEWWEDLYPYRYFFRHYHLPHIFRKKRVCEAFLMEGKLNDQFGPCTMEKNVYNKMFPDWLQITLKQSDPLNVNSYIWARENGSNFLSRFNQFFKENNNYPDLTDLTFFQRNILYNDHIGLAYYRFKMRWEEYFFFWFEKKKEKLFILKSNFLEYFNDEIDEIKLLIYIGNNKLGLAFQESAWGELFHYTALVLYYLILFIVIIGLLLIFLIRLFMFIRSFFKKTSN